MTVSEICSGIAADCRGLFFFFFFQAEDGIRDYKVTGVQTCALPISDRPRERDRPAPPHRLLPLRLRRQLRQHFGDDLRGAAARRLLRREDGLEVAREDRKSVV